MSSCSTTTERKAIEPEPVIRVLVVDDHEVVRRGLHAFLDGEPDLEVVADAGGGEEALANVVKHSAAQRAWVNIESSGGAVSLEIRDDGSGFDAQLDRPGHYGLESMRTRATEAGASLTILSVPGRGTVVRVVMLDHDGAEGHRA